MHVSFITLPLLNVAQVRCYSVFQHLDILSSQLEQVGAAVTRLFSSSKQLFTECCQWLCIHPQQGTVLHF